MGHFFPQQIIFRGLGLILYRKQNARNPTEPNSPQTPYYLLLHAHTIKRRRATVCRGLHFKPRHSPTDGGGGDSQPMCVELYVCKPIDLVCVSGLAYLQYSQKSVVGWGTELEPHVRSYTQHSLRPMCVACCSLQADLICVAGLAYLQCISKVGCWVGYGVPHYLVMRSLRNLGATPV